jgi:hypothetical protein
MFGLALPIILRIGGALLFAATLAYGWHRFTEHYREQGRQEIIPKLAQCQDAIAAAQERATQLALLWSAQVDKTEAAAKRQEVARGQTFGAIKDDARRIGTAGGVRFGADAVGVFDRARRAAEGQPAGPAAQPDKTTPPVAASSEEYIVQLYEWAAICKARVEDWQTFYRGLQQEANK